MNPTLLGAVCATLLVVFWLAAQRRPRPFLRSSDTSAVAALNRVQIELVRPSAVASEVVGAGSEQHPSRAAGGLGALDSAAVGAVAVALPGPADARGRRLLLQRLGAAAMADPQQRIEAMRIARRWGDRSVLPLLRRGLRDVHPAVVAEAALAMAAYRGRLVQPALRPRRVSRIR
jgi:hypothetical protein